MYSVSVLLDWAQGEQADQNTLFNAYTRQQLYPEDEGYTDYPFAPTGEQLFNDKKPSDVLKEGNFHFVPK